MYLKKINWKLFESLNVLSLVTKSSRTFNGSLGVDWIAILFQDAEQLAYRCREVTQITKLALEINKQ